MNAWTGFTKEFSHASEGRARVEDLPRAVAQGYAEVPDAIVEVEPERVAWGRDPYDPELLEEL